MKKIIAFFIVIVLMASCQNNQIKEQEPVNATSSKEEHQKQIKELEKKLFEDKTGLERSTANSVISLYVDYVNKYPKDPESPEYLFKAGEISSSLNLSEQAIKFFGQAHQNYPSFDKAPYCLFLQAFIYENQLSNLGKAKELYERTIEKYPDHQVAADSKASLQNLGKSEEELIREFEKKNKKTS